MPEKRPSSRRATGVGRDRCLSTAFSWENGGVVQAGLTARPARPRRSAESATYDQSCHVRMVVAFLSNEGWLRETLVPLTAWTAFRVSSLLAIITMMHPCTPSIKEIVRSF